MTTRRTNEPEHRRRIPWLPEKSLKQTQTVPGQIIVDAFAAGVNATGRGDAPLVILALASYPLPPPGHPASPIPGRLVHFRLFLPRRLSP